MSCPCYSNYLAASPGRLGEVLGHWGRVHGAYDTVSALHVHESKCTPALIFESIGVGPLKRQAGARKSHMARIQAAATRQAE